MVGLVIALLKGGAVAAAGYVGGTIAHSAMNIVKETCDYVYFDKENGWDKDHSDLINMSVPQKIGHLFKGGLMPKKEEGQ